MYLSNLSVVTKLRLMSAMAVLGMVIVAAVFLVAKKTATVEEKQEAVQHVVEVAHSIVGRYHKRAVAGELSEEDAKKAAMAALRDIRYGGDEYVWINDMHPNVVMHPIKPELDGKDASGIRDPEGKALFVRFVETVKQSGGGFVDYLWPKPGHDLPVPKVSYVKGFQAWGWVIGSGIYVDEVNEAFRQDLYQGSAIVAVIGILVLVLGLVLTRSITGPLGQAVELANKVADGDLTAEIGHTADNEVGKLLAALKRMNENLRRIVGEVRSSTDAISTASREIATGNADLSQRTEQQASSLEETASSMEQLTSTVKQNADNAKQANSLAAGASEVAVKGGQVVGQVVNTMSSINDSSRKIVDIIGVIDGIAFQTNILALNAAVEAARAGEQGRGFAVVATEVRTLAQRSAAAAKEIKQLISDSVGKVEDGTRLVDEAGNTMEEIVASVKRVTDIMGEISAASQEQSSGIEQVNQAVSQMDEVTQQNAALVEQAAAAAESMQEQAQNLAQTVALFKLDQGTPSTAAAARIAASVSPLPVRRAQARAQSATPVKSVTAGPQRSPARTGTDDEWQEF